jgi:tetratricopeptide (TPR) repeat protein
MVAGILPAILLAPEKSDWYKTLGGALIAMLAPVSLGAFIGFLLSLQESKKDFGTKLVAFVISALVGASLAQYGKIFEFFCCYIPKCADALSLNPSVLVLLFPMFFLPACYLGYNFNNDRFGEILEHAEKILDVVSRVKGKKDQEVYKWAYDLIEHVERKEYEAALTLFKKVKKVKDLKDGLNRWVGICYLGTDKFDDAIRCFSEYLANHPNDLAILKYQIKAKRGKHNLCGDGEEKERSKEETRNSANKWIEDGILKKEDVNDAWPNLISEDENAQA